MRLKKGWGGTLVPVCKTKNFICVQRRSHAWTALDVMLTLMSLMSMTFSLYAVAFE